MTSKRLKFAPEHVDAILDGRKWVTIRVDFDLEVNNGDRLALVDAERDEVFAHGTISMIGTVTPSWIVDADFEGHRSYETVGELIHHLRRYYPDERITPGRKVKIIEFENIQQAADYDLGLDPREPRPEEVGRLDE